MKTCCCSSHCKKYFDCQLADINNEDMNIVEDYHEWGSGTFTDEGCVIEHYCGELGDYKMFVPVEKITITVTQELDLGSDEEIQRHIDESGYTSLITPEQVRNIIRDGLYKMFKDAIKT